MAADVRTEQHGVGYTVGVGGKQLPGKAAFCGVYQILALFCHKLTGLINIPCSL